LPTVDDLLGHFKRQASLPWSPDMARDYRVWIMCYDKTLERRVHGRLHDFEAVARAFGHGWATLNLADLVAPWFGSHELFAGLADQPDELTGMLPDFETHVGQAVQAKLQALSPNDILALSGTGALFGLMRVSNLIDAVAAAINGRLLVLFPGRHENGTYRLLDARDGWTYRATPIPA
jgi:hypothetical protein